MADINAGHWILISDGSVDNIRQFFQGCREQGVETKGLVVAPPTTRKEIEACKTIDWPAGWSVYRSGPLWSRRDQWFGIVWDDQCPAIPRWDVGLVEKVHAWDIMTSADAVNGDLRAAAVVWGVPCLDAGGGLNLQTLDLSLRQWHADASEAKIWGLERTIQMPRAKGPRLGAEVIPNERTVAALRDLMKQCGAKIVEPDWTGVSIMICTPSMASRPEAMYTISLFAMIESLRSRGVQSQWSLERYNADIGLARSHILSEFLRSSFTHLLMIDDDMTWEVNALDRLMFADKPLVAVAGPKKRFPLVFAASNVGEKGELIPLEMDHELGVAEVTSVGSAFMLIRRDCAEKMRAGYPELEYVDGAGKLCWGVFLQQIHNRSYLPEDFSFCQRWRNLGEKVYICPDVPLGHIGSHEFKGDLLSNAMKRQDGINSDVL